MKIIYVTGADYAALALENSFKDTLVSDFIKEHFQDNKTEIELEFSDENMKVNVELLEFGEIDERFIEFISHRFIDYDQSKHENFYVENQKI